jgi:hypothetical protein
MAPKIIERWHHIIAANHLDELDEILAEEAVFESPVVFKPQAGKALTTMYLTAAAKLLNNGSFRYVNEWFAERSAVLEFESVVDGIAVNGVDMIFWNDAEKIVRFKVMVRPRKAMDALQDAMGRLLAAATKP